MNTRVLLCAGCVLCIVCSAAQSALAPSPPDTQSNSRGDFTNGTVVTSCPEFREAVGNISVEKVVVSGQLVCSNWQEQVVVDRHLSVQGRPDANVYDSIDFMGDGCMIEVQDKSALVFSDLLLLGDWAGVLCTNGLSFPTVGYRNVSLGWRVCDLSSEDLSPDVCELQENVFFIEAMKMEGANMGTGYDIEFAKVTVLCVESAATTTDLMKQKIGLPASCEPQARKHKTLNATVVGYVVGFVVPSLVVLVGVLAVLVKTGKHRLVWNKLEKFRGAPPNNSWDSFTEIVRSSMRLRVQRSPESGTSAVRLSLPTRPSDAAASSEASNDGAEGVKEDPLWQCISVQDIQLKEPLGKGQFSTVYKGDYKGTTVAVKMIEHEGRLLDAGKVPMEVQLSKDISHPNVVALLLDRTQKRITHFSGMFTSTGFVQTDMFGSEESIMTGISQTTMGDGMSIAGLSQTTMGAMSAVTPTLTPMSNTTLGDVFAEVEMRQRDKALDDRDAEYTAYTTWLVMEYCDRGSLSSALYNRVFCSPGGDCRPHMAHILLTAMDVAAAMRYLHMRGIIHGDLKAQNCLLKSDPSDSRGFVCKVGDFGFSRKIGMDTHIETFTCGTVSHQPPELLRDGILTPAADVYSFGLLMWQMVMCRAPYANMNNQRILVSVVEGRRPPLPENCPLGYNLLMTDCWQENYKERPGFEQILDRLGEVLSEWSPQHCTHLVETPVAHCGDCADSGQESFRLPVPRAAGLWNYNVDHRTSDVSSDGMLWNPSSPIEATAAPVFPAADPCPRPVQPMSPGNFLQHFDGSNPLYRSSSDVKTPDPNTETLVSSDCKISCLQQPRPMTKSSTENMVLNRGQRGTKHGKFILTTPRT